MRRDALRDASSICKGRNTYVTLIAEPCERTGLDSMMPGVPGYTDPPVFSLSHTHTHTHIERGCERGTPPLPISRTYTHILPDFGQKGKKVPDFMNHGSLLLLHRPSPPRRPLHQPTLPPCPTVYETRPPPTLYTTKPPPTI